MSKRKDGEERRLSVVKGTKPEPDPQDATDAEPVTNAIATFKVELNKLIDLCDQVILVGCQGGFVTVIHSLDPDRHKVIGALAEAYDIASSPYVDDD